MRKTIKLPNLQNVSAGGTATLSCPVGLTYDVITLEHTGVTAAQIKDIEVRVNGKVLQEYKNGDQVNALNTYYGRGTSAGFLELWFIRPELDTVKEQRLTALGTGDIQTLDISLEIDALATAPAITAYAIQSEPAALGVITKIRRFPLTFSAGGEQDISNLPLNGARIAAMHLESSVDISKTRVLVNSVDVFEATDKVAAQIQNRYGRTADSASDYFRADFMLEGDLSQAIITQGVQDFRVKPTLAGGGQVDVLVEYLDGFNGL